MIEAAKTWVFGMVGIISKHRDLTKFEFALRARETRLKAVADHLDEREKALHERKKKLMSLHDHLCAKVKQLDHRERKLSEAARN